MPAKPKAARAAKVVVPPEYQMRLYVAGQSARSIAAIANLQRICSTHLDGRYTIEVIDLVANPQLAKADNILALPTLVRGLPEPIKRIIGDLSNIDRVLLGLDLTSVPTVATRGKRSP